MKTKCCSRLKNGEKTVTKTTLDVTEIVCCFNIKLTKNTIIPINSENKIKPLFPKL